MMMPLIDRGLWELVEGTEKLKKAASTEAKIKHKRREQKALALTGLHAGDTNLPHIVDAKTPKCLWDTLKNLYAEQSRAHRIHLRRQLQQIKLRERESVIQYVKRMKNIVHRPSAAGCVPSDDSQVCARLNGLPRKYRTKITLLDSQTVELSVSSVTA